MKKYKAFLDLMETEEAIKFAKDIFEHSLASELKLSRVSAPLAVLSGTGINDHLNGIERPVVFPVKDLHDAKAEVVQSLAKWKRLALARYGIRQGHGLYTDMNAIRPDEVLDDTHSIYVDQWDWEKVISRKIRNIAYLKKTVRKIYKILVETEKIICRKYKKLSKPFLPKDIYFIEAAALEQKYPSLTPKQREDAICKEKGAVFIIGIGHKLLNGYAHDGRAADYDDWHLNGDILIWYPLFSRALELSSMGIRVDRKSLLKQLTIRGEEYKKKLTYHKLLLAGKLPLTIGGGIGQSRICMFFLRKKHVGEVQASIWTEKILKKCQKDNIVLL